MPSSYAIWRKWDGGGDRIQGAYIIVVPNLLGVSYSTIFELRAHSCTHLSFDRNGPLRMCI